MQSAVSQNPLKEQQRLVEELSSSSKFWLKKAPWNHGSRTHSVEDKIPNVIRKANSLSAILISFSFS
jgi:hypothetical protein